MNKTILLVEDEAIIALTTSKMLKKHGYTVVIAKNGEQAVIEVTGNQTIHLILMDINLGKGMDGTQAARKILKYRDVPVLFLSSHTEKEVVEKTEKITSYGYVVKNSGETVLLASIRMAFKLHETRKELEEKNRELVESKSLQTEAEEKLRGALDRFALATDAADLAIWDWNIREDRLIWDDRMFDLYGVSREDPSPTFQTWLRFILPEDRERLRKETEKALAGEKDFNTEFRIRRKDGKIRHIKADGYTEKDSSGKPLRMTGVNSDITERKIMEKTQLFLAESGWIKRGEDFFHVLARFLAETLDMDYVCIDSLSEDNISAQTVAVYYDGQFEENIEYILQDTPCGDVVGKPVCCFPQDVRHLFPKDLILQEMYAESYVGTTLRGSDSDQNPIGLIAVISRTPLENPEPVSAVLQLVGTRAASELERRKGEEEMKKLVTQKEILLEELQHRVKNSFLTVSNLLSLEIGKLTDARSRDIFLNAQNRIQSMAKIYDRLNYSVDLNSVDLLLYIREMADSIFNTYNRDIRGISIDTSDEELFLDTKRAMPLGLILNELITNSVKHAYPQGREGEIRIRLEKQGEMLSLRIEDDGIGFPQKGTTEKERGMGMRLVKMLCEQIGAELRMESDGGTRITISLDL